MPLERMTAEHLASSAGGFEPQRRNHFQIEIYMPSNLEQEILRMSIVSGFLPQEGNEAIEMSWMNESSWIAGRRTLEGGSIRCRDFLDQATANVILKWRRLVYDPRTGALGYAMNYKREACIILTGPDGVMHERKWKLQGLWPTSVEHGNLEYNSNEVLEMSVSLRFDRAIPLFLEETT
jgi:hypothetical protein